MSSNPLFGRIIKTASRVLRKDLLLFPGKIQIETTAACNANCIMCPHSSIKRSKTHMPYALYKKIIDECAENSGRVTEVLPFLNGELFLTPKWEDYLSYAREKLRKARLSVFTNGSLLNEANVAKLLEILPDHINISFDGTDKATYEGIRRNLRFEEVEGNIRAFISKRNSMGLKKPAVTISIVEMERTAAGIPAFVQRWKGIADSVSVEPYNTWAGNVGDMSGSSKEGRPRVPCPRLWYNLTVLNSGKVALCCLDHEGKVELGDLNTRSIAEVWNGEALAGVRRAHEEGAYGGLPLCGNCDYGKYQSETPFWWV